MTLSDLYRHQGPFATVVVRTPSSVSDASHRLEIRWKNVRRELESHDAPHELLTRFDGLAAQLELGHRGNGIATVVTAGAAPLVEFLRDDPLIDSVRIGGIPTLTPFLASRQGTIPHVVAFTDRTGADLVAVSEGAVEDYVVVDGETTHIHRGHAGGWSQRRFQQRAENRWESNANEVAEALSTLARRVEARLVCVSGDVRAVGFLCDHLPTDLTSMVVTLQEGEPDAVWAAVDRAVADVVQRESDALVTAVADRRPHRTATTNVSDVLRALGEGRVQTLLVHDDGSDDVEAWFGPDLDPAGSLHRNRDDLERGRLVDVAVRSALLTQATVRVVPSPPSGEGPVAALLRW